MDRRYIKRIGRYWQKMEQKGFSALSRVEISEWFDYWHTHPDWDGKGNKCIENRRSVIELGYKLLKAAEEMCEGHTNPIQCWATVCEDTGNNAVYLHTENPNGTPFPYTFQGAEWNSTDNTVLNEVVNVRTHEIGKHTYSDQVVYIIRSRTTASSLPGMST